jgi:hypothetical protein
MSNMAASLAGRADAWLYAASSGERFDPGRMEREDHETVYWNLVNMDAAKFGIEPSWSLSSVAELERTAEGMRGMCVMCIVVCLEGDETALSEDAEMALGRDAGELSEVAGAVIVIVQITSGWGRGRKSAKWRNVYLCVLVPEDCEI